MSISDDENRAVSTDVPVGEPQAAMPHHLKVSGLVAGYGSVGILNGATFDVGGGEIVALVGRNGAGKSTALNCVVGLRHSRVRGAVVIDSTDVTHSSTHEIVRLGVRLCAEGRRIFRTMSVWKNLCLGAVNARQGSGTLGDDLERVYALFPTLRRCHSKDAGALSGGEQQMVAVGAALMSKPSILLLDEPAAGLAPIVVSELYEAFHRLAQDGIGLLVVDQSIERAFAEADRFFVMEGGKVVLSGWSNDSVVEQASAIVMGRAALNPTAR